MADSPSPIVVVLSGSMEPAFQRGDLLFLWNRDKTAEVGEIVVYNVRGKDIPIVHRVVRSHAPIVSVAVDARYDRFSSISDLTINVRIAGNPLKPLLNCSQKVTTMWPMILNSTPEDKVIWTEKQTLLVASVDMYRQLDMLRSCLANTRG